MLNEVEIKIWMTVLEVTLEKKINLVELENVMDLKKWVVLLWACGLLRWAEEGCVPSFF